MLLMASVMARLWRLDEARLLRLGCGVLPSADDAGGQVSTYSATSPRSLYTASGSASRGPQRVVHLIILTSPFMFPTSQLLGEKIAPCL
ncbi:hypothetical protein BLA15816_00871 [Burkholderia lata]|uniref:Uncharacterized protein n=1 Tax=Burkholderia lata (strain ATCC 17760 / DSM 23089 / LMG 22485 / NCIMB 9086 / R18194 / 383) TaxID=482957 RepID=A0A6P2GQT0_BURL3|nr:hypothetical protein BLA15945_00126 [Burkholderia lata]VWB21771.1 hypothetical protein BLA15816_00871 [Burkholderia lata]